MILTSDDLEKNLENNLEKRPSGRPRKISFIKILKRD